MADKPASKNPAIARIWRGCTKPEHADPYEVYNYDDGIKGIDDALSAADR